MFYGWHVPLYLLILLVSAGVDYVAALAIAGLPAPAEAERRPASRRRRWLVASLTVNLGMLAFFKYANFGIEAANGLLEAPRAPAASRHGSNVVLPMGISFYTFQSMSYTIDVYRGRAGAHPSFSRFLLFITFFPQLVAGPIVRATEFIPQLVKRRRLHLPVSTRGCS